MFQRPSVDCFNSFSNKIVQEKSDVGIMRENVTHTKRKCRRESSLEALPLQSLEKSNGSKTPYSKVGVSIEELPDVLLVEILCRLPSSKLIFQCKCVSKRWRTLTSRPDLIGRFLYIQSQQQTPTVHTLISRCGDEIVPRTWSVSKLELLKKFKSFSGLGNLVVEAAHYDLVLCCATDTYQRDYCICNPSTMQWVPLPPAPTHCHKHLNVGFICDIPYYDSSKGNGGGDIIKLNDDFGYHVVRLLPHSQQLADNDRYDSLNLEIFSSKTGKWSECVVPFPGGFHCNNFGADGFVYGGMLYWMGCNPMVSNEFKLFGLGPFNNTSESSNGDEITYQRLRFTLFQHSVRDKVFAECSGVHGDRVRICDWDNRKRFYVWELKEKNHGQMVDGCSNLCFSKYRVYKLHQYMFETDFPTLRAFDPKDEDVIYVRDGRDIVRCNVRTRKWYRLYDRKPLETCAQLLPYVQPWWPTPILRLPEPSQE